MLIILDCLFYFSARAQLLVATPCLGSVMFYHHLTLTFVLDSLLPTVKHSVLHRLGFVYLRPAIVTMVVMLMTVVVIRIHDKMLHVYVCVDVCIYARMWLCTCTCLYVCMHTCMHARMLADLLVFLYVCMFVCLLAYMFVFMSKYLRRCACACVCVCLC